MDQAQRLGRRAFASMAAAAVPLGAVTFGQPDAAAAPAWQIPPPPVPMVDVTGYGSVRVPPDMASIVIGVEAQRPTLAEAQAEATTQATAIIDALKSAGVAEQDLRTTDFSVRIVRERQRGDDETQRGEIKGFRVSDAVEVTVRELAKLGRILDDAVAAGANDVRRIAFSLADTAPAAAQARGRAMDDARAKAEALATAAGVTLGRVLSISETSSLAPTPVAFETAADGVSGEVARAEVPIAIGTDEVAVEVSVVYELL